MYNKQDICLYRCKFKIIPAAMLQKVVKVKVRGRYE